MLSVKPVSFPLPRSLSRYAPAVRLRRADGTHRRVIAITGKKRACGKSHGVAVFHRLRPLTSITETDAQISGGETRQDLKIPGVSPGGSLVRSPVPAFRFTGVIPLLWPRLSHSTPDTQFREGSSLKLDCMHEPPFSPTAAPYPVTIVLSPTRKDMQKRHWQQPLVTDLEEIVLNLCAG